MPITDTYTIIAKIKNNRKIIIKFKNKYNFIRNWLCIEQYKININYQKVFTDYLFQKKKKKIDYKYIILICTYSYQLPYVCIKTTEYTTNYLYNLKLI